MSEITMFELGGMIEKLRQEIDKVNERVDVLCDGLQMVMESPSIKEMLDEDEENRSDE